MNGNNDNNELKLRDAPLKPLEQGPSELKLRDDSTPGLELKSKDEPSELKLVDKAQSSSTPARREEKALPPLAEKKDASQFPHPETGSSPDASGNERKKRGSAISIIFQVIIMIVSVAAIIIACYFINKNLSADTPTAPSIVKDDAAKSAKPKQEAVKDQKKTGKDK
ncbi:MAG: hypothetical protein WAX69_09890 [Victivallales bacterium]